MIKYNNPTNIHPLLAAMLAYDDYDYNNNKNVISTTSLMKPTRMLALERTHMDSDKVIDLEACIPSVMGSAMHKLLEVSLEDIKDEIWDMFHIDKKDIVISREIREERVIPGTDLKLSGKYDVLYKYKDEPARLADLKTMSVWGTMLSDKEKTLEYTTQMSIYRWLNQDIEIGDIGEILYWYTDWSKTSALRDRRYPQSRVGHKEIALWSLEYTEGYIVDNIKDLVLALETIELTGEPGVACSPVELWQSDPKFKYYKPGKQGRISYTRATKVCDSLEEAQAVMRSAGGVGDIKEFPAEVKRCKYCSVTEYCTQYTDMVAKGLIQ